MGRILVALLGALGILYGALPPRIQRWKGVVVGKALRVLGFRLQVVRSGLARAFADPLRREVVEREFYSHLGHLFLTFFTMFGLWRRQAMRFGQLEGIEHWRRARAEGKGVIFLSSHLGNWELMAAVGSLAGIDLLMVTKRLKPAWFHGAIERARLSCGIKGTYEPQTLRDILRQFREGGAVGFVIDQYTGPPVGIRVPFLGVPVGTHSAPATLAKRTGALVLPVSGTWEGQERFVVKIGPPLPWISDENPHREIALNTAAYSAEIERRILERPEQWLWTHQRFKGDLSPLAEGEWEGSRPREGRPR